MKLGLLVRHGESDINVKGTLSDEIDNNKLTEKGKKQVEHTAREISGIKFDRIVSSPIGRTRETAKILADYLGIEVLIDDRLREIGLGKANGRKIDEFRNTLYSGHISGKIRETLEMERWDHLVLRVTEAISAYEGKTIFVSHSDPIRAAISYCLDMGESETYGISLKNASFTAMEIENKKLYCIGSVEMTEKLMKYLQEK
ncbi:MAG: 2,3-diphosphoglycerate-dependent phosphoglycerate mutase [Thermoplasmata archaeon]